MVEDNPGDVRLLKEMLKKSQSAVFKIDSIDCLSRAIEKLKENIYDLLLLDLGLPDSQGLDTVRQMRHAVPDIPIVIMTGLSDENIGLQAVEEGAQDFLVKWEVGEAMLMRTIRYAIERKQSEMAIRESEKRFRNIVETAGEGIWMVNVEEKTSFVNQQMADMLGYNIEDIIGHHINNFMDEEAQLIAKAHLERHRQGIKEQYDFRYRRKDASDLWAIVSITPLINNQGQYEGSLKMINDITERKKSEFREKARFTLLNRLRSANSIDECLQYGCKAIYDSDLFKKAVFILYNNEGNITSFGQYGLDKNLALNIKKGKAPDSELLSSLVKPKYRISKSYFIPAGSIANSPEQFPNVAGENGAENNPSWNINDLLIIPTGNIGDNKQNSLVSVAYPVANERPPTNELILRVEEIIDMVTIRALEIAHAKELALERQALAEKNVALKEIMSVIEAEKMEIRQQIAGMIDQVLKPAVSRLVRRDGSVNRTYYDLLKYNLDELSVATGGALHISSKLSPREMEICAMIKNGASSKDIAEALDIALVTVQKHREVIRKKLGLTNKNINLTTHLRNM
jgi:two-component system, NarL family, sensor histidine kinase UhpB